MQKIQSILASAVLVSGLSHIFCCGLPLLFSLLSVLVGLGVTSVLPTGFSEFHEILHVWEIPLLVSSGAILFIGWALYIISKRMDCHSTGCAHEPCGKKKKESHRILILATLLFCVNAAMLLLYHDHNASQQNYAAEQEVHVHESGSE